ncbi:hypothetical protein [Oceanobacillus sp. CAU 1775]
MNWKVNLLLIAFVLLLGACSDGSNMEIEQENNQNEESQVDLENEEDAVSESEPEETFTLASMESTPFEDLAGQTAIKVMPGDWEQPYELSDIRWGMFYGDNEFIMSAPDEGVFRYDLAENQLKWETKHSLAEKAMHNGVFYGAQLADPSNFANVGTIDIATGEITGYYEEENHQIAGLLHFMDDLMLFTSPANDKDKNPDRDLFVYDLQSKTKLWTVPMSNSLGQQAIDLGENILLVNDLTHEGNDDQIASVYDKETGEEQFEIVANAIRKHPVVNSEGIYFADHRAGTIQLYDFEGNLIEEATSIIGFGLQQLMRPIATEEAFILADNEGIAWYSPDLATIQHRVDFGEMTLRHLVSTDDRLYVIVSDKETDEFFIVTLDLQTGEAYEKVSLEIDDKNAVVQPHVYNNKYSFAINTREAGLVYYVFSSDVDRPIE